MVHFQRPSMTDMAASMQQSYLTFGLALTCSSMQAYSSVPFPPDVGNIWYLNNIM